jgi:hypothetical protein
MDGDSSTTRHTSTGLTLRLHRQLNNVRESTHVTDAPAASTCWCISKGMAGMNSQTSGLAKAVGFENSFEFRHATLKFPWNGIPVPLVPRRASVLRHADVLDGPPPRLVVSCGRHGVLPALTLKKQLGDRVFTVHVQDPKTSTRGFDMVVVPKHDGVRGDNVYLTTGALHYVTPQRLAEAAQSPLSIDLKPDERPLVAVLLGGRNGYYAFSRNDVERLVVKLKRVVSQYGVRLAILKSNRTSADAARRFETEFGSQHFVWSGENGNPYFAALALADYLVVTGDSVSMVSEATVNGKPIFVEYLREKSVRPARRFRRFHRMFEEAGFTRPFEGELAEWTYEPPQDTPRIAQLIRERMGIA